MDANKLAQLLSEALEVNELTVAAAAALTQVSAKQLRRILKGKVGAPHPGTLFRLQKLLFARPTDQTPAPGLPREDALLAQDGALETIENFVTPAIKEGKRVFVVEAFPLGPQGLDVPPHSDYHAGIQRAVTAVIHRDGSPQLRRVVLLGQHLTIHNLDDIIRIIHVWHESKIRLSIGPMHAAERHFERVLGANRRGLTARLSNSFLIENEYGGTLDSHSAEMLLLRGPGSTVLAQWQRAIGELITSNVFYDPYRDGLNGLRSFVKSLLPRNAQ